ncbi:MAG: hypothetical protein RI883_2395, partial [Bacteroidota bacterium]
LKPITILGCGRTDTGVHAKEYFFHVDLEPIDSIDQFVFKLNRMLPDSIVVHAAELVDSEKHARFEAKRRTYRYFIHQKKDAFITATSWYFPQKLDISKMNEAAQLLIGTKDFTSLSKLHTDVKTNICTIDKAHWVVDGNQLYFEISADRFLRNMVRATVGTLIEVGLGKIEPAAISGIIEAKDRQAASTSVPAHGLFLWEIEY